MTQNRSRPAVIYAAQCLVGFIASHSAVLIPATICHSYIEPGPRGIGGTSSSQIGYAELNDFRRTLLAAEVRNRAQRVVEAVGEISGADHQRELNNLTFVVILAQLLERTGADRGSTAGDPLGVKNRGLLFFVEE